MKGPIDASVLLMESCLGGQWPGGKGSTDDESFYYLGLSLSVFAEMGDAGGGSDQVERSQSLCSLPCSSSSMTTRPHYPSHFTSGSSVFLDFHPTLAQFPS